VNEIKEKSKLDAVVAEAKALDEQLAELNAAPHERKIRFEDAAGNVGKASINTSRFIKRHTLEDYSLEELALCRKLLAIRGAEMPDAFEDKFQSLADKAHKLTMTTDGSATGAELVDTILYNRLFNDVVNSTLVADLFAPWIQMSAGTVDLPSIGNVTFYKPAGEGQAVTATDLATAKRSMKAYTVKAQVDISDEENEDAIIAMIPEIRAILVRNAREAIDEAILNADASTGTQNLNYYAASGGSNISTAHRLLLGFDGLIHYCLNEVTGQVSDIGSLDYDDFATLISKLGKYADDPSRCAFIIDRDVKNKAIQIEEFLTVDKMGPKATLLTGQIGQIFGVPVILSGQLAKANATGQVDQTGDNNTKGRIVLVNRDMWRLGLRRSITVEAQRDAAKTLTSLVASMRIGLQCYGDRSSADNCHTALGYNVTV
jgi:HK97 family phage major capsid protein